MRQALGLEERKVIYVCECEGVPLVKVGTGTKGVQVVGVEQPRVVSRGGVVNRVAERIGGVQLESANVVTHRNFQSVVVRGRRLVFASDTGPAEVRAIEVWVLDATGNGQIVGPSSRHRDSVAGIHVSGCGSLPIGADRNRGTVIRRDYLSGSVWILAVGNRQNLVQGVRTRQVNARTANVRQRSYRASPNIVLNIEMPLPHIGPSGFARNRCRSQWRRATAKQARVEIGV